MAFDAKQSIVTVLDELERAYKIIRNEDANEAGAFKNLEIMEKEILDVRQKHGVKDAIAVMKHLFGNLKMVLRLDIRDGKFISSVNSILKEMEKKLEKDDYTEDIITLSKLIEKDFEEVSRILVDQVRIDKKIRDLEKEDIGLLEKHPERFDAIVNEFVKYIQQDENFHKLGHRNFLNEEKMLLELKQKIEEIYEKLYGQKYQYKKMA
ncbi:MAG: hypothetical protein AB7V77_01710 [Candidatus Woesearchaeota archaeon]